MKNEVILYICVSFYSFSKLESMVFVTKKPNSELNVAT